MSVSHDSSCYRSYIRVEGRGVHTDLSGVPQIPDEVHQHFCAGHDDLPPVLRVLADEAIEAAMKELQRPHLENGKRGEELDFEEFIGDYW